MPDYYNPYSASSTNAMVLNSSQMQTNAVFIYNYLSTKYGWTKEAISGLLANAQAESTINPARPQNNAVNNKWYPSCPGYAGDAPNPTDTWYGYGLFQITPYRALTGRRENPYNYGNWAASRGYTFSYSNGGSGGMMEPQLDWLGLDIASTPYYNAAQPSANQAKWYQHASSPMQAPKPSIYGKLIGSPEDCATTFYYNLERSASGNPGNRPSLARTWYQFLKDVTPTPPKPPTKDIKTNFIIIAYASGVIK